MPVSSTATSRAIVSLSVSAVSIAASKHLLLQADFRRAEREGWGIAGAPFYTSSALLAAPIDEYTDTANLMATYGREKWSTSLSWTGSFYQDPESAAAVGQPVYRGWRRALVRRRRTTRHRP